VFKLLGASSANSTLGVELNGNFPGQEACADDMKVLQETKFVGKEFITVNEKILPNLLITSLINTLSFVS
jgi:hypothetical protein